MSLVLLFLAAPGLAQEALSIEPPVREPGAASIRITGFDPAGPRPLALWRHANAELVRLDTTTSDPKGRFDFGQTPIPIAEASLHVAPLGIAPDLSRPLMLSLKIPAPHISSSPRNAHQIDVTPALFEGRLEIRDAASGRLYSLRPISAVAGRSLHFDLLEEGLSQSVSAILLQQVLDDGRRSGTTYWGLGSD